MSQGHLQLWEIKETKDNYQAVQTDTNEWRHSVICIHQQITIWKGIETNNSPSITSTLIKDFAMDGMRMTRLAHWKWYMIAEKYPKAMDRDSIAMTRLQLAIPWNASAIWNEDSIWITKGWKVAAKPQKMPAFLASRGEFNPGQVTKLDGSEVFCEKVWFK